jgi:hypothetical protein
MSENSVVDALGWVAKFRGSDLKIAVARLETLVANRDRLGLGTLLMHESVTGELLRAAVLIKRSAAQIDSIVHAAGILLSLPELLEEGETIQEVSLAAGNTGKPFDLVTDRRIAEFTFIDWKGGSESIRKQKLFKDFYLLAEADSAKRRCLYFLGDKHAPKVFGSRSTCESMLVKYAPLRDRFVQTYGSAIPVRQYYETKKDLVALVNLERVAPKAAAAFKEL